MAIDKSKWNTNVKVSQKTIDEIKKMGMSKALKTVAGASKASGMDASAKAWVEGVKRLYGANRVAAATKSTPKSSSYPSPSSAGRNSNGMGSTSPKMPKPGPAARVASKPATPSRTYGPTIANPAASAKPKTKATPKPSTPNKSAITPIDKAKIAQAKSDWLSGKRNATTSAKKAPSKPKAKVTSLAPTRQY